MNEEASKAQIRLFREDNEAEAEEVHVAVGSLDYERYRQLQEQARREAEADREQVAILGED